jgi:hypothetical protein
MTARGWWGVTGALLAIQAPYWILVIHRAVAAWT